MDKKHAYLFCKFLEMEMQKIDLDKYFEGIRIQNDPGQSYVIKWINENAAQFRQEWEKSCCQHCYNWKECGLNLLKDCKNFIQDSEGNINLK